MSRGWQAVVFAFLLAVPVHSRAQPEGSAGLVLYPAGKVSGRVVDSNGRPIVGAHVQTDPPRQRPIPIDCPTGEPIGRDENGPIVISDAAGSFTISPVAPGTYELGAYAEGYTPGWSDRLEVRSGKKTTGATIVLEPVTRLAGRVVDSEGRPVSGAEISLSGTCPPFEDPRIRSAEDGSYSVRCIMPGLQRIEIEHPEHSTIFTDLQLTPGDNTLDWTLRKRVEVQGRIVTPDGTPAEAEKAVILSPQSLGDSWFPTALREDSRFSGWIDAGGPQEISAQMAGYAEGKVILPASGPGDRIGDVEIESQAAGTSFIPDLR